MRNHGILSLCDYRVRQFTVSAVFSMDGGLTRFVVGLRHLFCHMRPLYDYGRFRSHSQLIGGAWRWWQNNSSLLIYYYHIIYIYQYSKLDWHRAKKPKKHSALFLSVFYPRAMRRAPVFIQSSWLDGYYATWSVSWVTDDQIMFVITVESSFLRHVISTVPSLILRISNVNY